MKKNLRRLLGASAGLSLALSAIPAHAAFETLSTAGTPVLKVCQGTESNRNPVTGVCQVRGDFPTTTNGVRTFPGLGGSNWALYASNNNQAVIANGTEVGRIDDRIWRRGTSNDYVFGIRITMNNRRWQPPLATCGPKTRTSSRSTTSAASASTGWRRRWPTASTAPTRASGWPAARRRG